MNNTHKIENSIAKNNNNLKAVLMGILLIITATFLVVSNTDGTVIAQSSNNGGSDEFKVTIFHLPKQTTDASTQVTLNNGDPNHNYGQANINIPGIGSGILLLDFQSSNAIILANIENIPGQNGESDTDIPLAQVGSNSYLPIPQPISIPGIGIGYISITEKD